MSDLLSTSERLPSRLHEPDTVMVCLRLKLLYQQKKFFMVGT